MYRYLVFAYEDYYPFGGMNDCVLKTNDLKEVESKKKEIINKIKNNIHHDYEYIQVYDFEKGEVIYELDESEDL